MTAPARIKQADYNRAIAAISKLDRARVVFDLANQRIEVIIGDVPPPAPAPAEDWPDDDT
jgi:hypothetical protein